MAENESHPSPGLCDLMLRLKLENPEMGKKEMHSAVQAEGSDWEKISLEQVQGLWKKMKKRSYKNKENRAGATGSQKSADKEPDATNSGSVSGTSQKPALGKQPPTNLVTSDEVVKAMLYQAKDVAAGSRIALKKQLKYLKDNPAVNYIIFTADNEPADCAIQLADAIGEVFFNVMWNRVIKAPFGSPSVACELWMIYQQLEASLLPKYRKLLRKQLQEEFGLDPFEGKKAD